MSDYTILFERNVAKCSKNSENLHELKIREKNAEEKFVLFQISKFDTEMLFRVNAICWPKKLCQNMVPNLVNIYCKKKFNSGVSGKICKTFCETICQRFG